MQCLSRREGLDILGVRLTYFFLRFLDSCVLRNAEREVISVRWKEREGGETGEGRGRSALTIDEASSGDGMSSINSSTCFARCTNS
jgi:hypothetical protein